MRSVRIPLVVWLPAAMGAAVWLAAGLASIALPPLGSYMAETVRDVLVPPTLRQNQIFGGDSALLIGALAALLVATVIALFAWLVARAGRLARFFGVWTGAVVASVLAAAVQIGGPIAGIDHAFSTYSSVVSQNLPFVVSAAWSGLVIGWIPALGAALVRARPAASRYSRILAAVLAGVAVIAAVSLVSVQSAEVTADRFVAGTTPAPIATEPAPLVIPGPDPEVVPPFDPAACTLAQVAITLGAPDAATGHRILPLSMRNTASVPCDVEGYPSVAMRSGSGLDVRLFVEHGTSFMAIDPGPVRFTLQPGASVRSFLSWNAGAPAGSDTVASVSVLPRAGDADADALTWYPFALDLTDLSTVTLSAWQDATLPLPN